MSKRFPADKLTWLKDATWQGPQMVPVEQIDTSHKDTWAVATDGSLPKHRKTLLARQAKGKQPKPVILIRTPGADKDIVVDGHHRVAAVIAEKQPAVWAYVGHVKSTAGG